MCRGSVEHTARITCQVFIALSFVAAIAVLYGSYMRFYKPDREFVYATLEVKQNDLVVTGFLVSAVYILFIIGWVGVGEDHVTIMIVYGVLMYLLGIALFIFAIARYGPSHDHIVESMNHIQKRIWKKYDDSSTNELFTLAQAIMWHVAAGLYGAFFALLLYYRPKDKILVVEHIRVT